MRCVIVDYGSGNVRSVHRALCHVGEGFDIVLSDDLDVIASADYLVLPGVGAFGACYSALMAKSGLEETLCTYALKNQRPFLGICVGMQLLADYGDEDKGSSGLGWIGGQVRGFNESLTQKLPIPHMGWTTVQMRSHPLAHGFSENPSMYFVHSFVFCPKNPHNIWAHSCYGEDFTSIVGHENIVGTQFHPEKSQHAGLQFLKNFLSWRP